MALDLAADGTGVFTDPRDLVAQIGHVNHLLHIAEAVCPVGIVLAGNGSDIFTIVRTIAGGIWVEEIAPVEILRALATATRTGVAGTLLSAIGRTRLRRLLLGLIRVRSGLLARLPRAGLLALPLPLLRLLLSLSLPLPLLTLLTLLAGLLPLAGLLALLSLLLTLLSLALLALLPLLLSLRILLALTLALLRLLSLALLALLPLTLLTLLSRLLALSGLLASLHLLLALLALAWLALPLLPRLLALLLCLLLTLGILLALTLLLITRLGILSLLTGLLFTALTLPALGRLLTAGAGCLSIAVGSGLRALAHGTVHLFLHLLGKGIQFTFGQAKRFDIVAQNTFGGFLDPLFQFVNLRSSLLLELAGFGVEVSFQQLARSVEGILSLALGIFPQGLVKLPRQQRLDCLRLVRD